MAKIRITTEFEFTSIATTKQVFERFTPCFKTVEGKLIELKGVNFNVLEVEDMEYPEVDIELL